jgi:hypothetical protein
MILKDLFQRETLQNIGELHYDNLGVKIIKKQTTQRNDIFFKVFYIGDDEAIGVISLTKINDKIISGYFNIEGVTGSLDNSVH